MQAKIRFFQDANTCEEIRRLPVPTNFALLLEKIQSIKSNCENVVLRYVDDQGDLVAFSTQEEFEIACELARKTEIPFLDIHVLPRKAQAKAHHHHHHHHHHRHHLKYVKEVKEVKEAKPMKNEWKMGRIVEETEDQGTRDPGTPFLHKVVFRNDSETAWPAGCKLSFMRGHSWTNPRCLDQTAFSAQSWIFANPSEPLPPNHQVEVVLPLICPQAAGKHVEIWRLVDPNGQKFGERVKIRVFVKGDKESKFSSSSSSSAQPSQVEKSDWSEELSVLSALGFTDAQKNIRMLVRHDGNMEKVVEKLEWRKRVWSKHVGGLVDSTAAAEILKEVPRKAFHLPLEAKLDFLDSHKLGSSRRENETALAAHHGRLRPTILSLLSSSSSK